MSRYRKIEYIQCVGCHHDENNELTGGQEIPMVALYDSEHISEMAVREHIELDLQTPHLMIIPKVHYDNILKPAVEEAKNRKETDE